MYLMNDNYKNDKAVLFFLEEDLLFEIHLLRNVIWGMWIFAIGRKIWFIQSAPSEHQLEPEDPNRERMDSVTMLEFQTRMANLDYEGSRCLFFTVSRLEQGLQFTRRIGLAQETKLRGKSLIDFWLENSVLGENNNSTLHKSLFGPCDASLLFRRNLLQLVALNYYFLLSWRYWLQFTRVSE